MVDTARRELWVEALSTERLQVVNQEGPQMQYVVPAAQREILYSFYTSTNVMNMSNECYIRNKVKKMTGDVFLCKKYSYFYIRTIGLLLHRTMLSVYTYIFLSFLGD